MNGRYFFTDAFVKHYDVVYGREGVPAVFNIPNEQFKDNMEDALKHYINSILGFKFNYSGYEKEIQECFEDLMKNSSPSDYSKFPEYIESRIEHIFSLLGKNQYSACLIRSLRNIYSNDLCGTVLCNTGSSFTVQRCERRGEEDMPVTYISDINVLESTLREFVFNIINTDNLFKNVFLDGAKLEDSSFLADKYGGTQDEDKLIYLFEWVLKNASSYDLNDINVFFRKYNSFITDKSFDCFNAPTMIGKFFGDDLYVMKKKSDVAYETPYYLSFVLDASDKVNNKVELPNIRLGIDDSTGSKIAYILATQTSQDSCKFEQYPALNDCFKAILGKIKHYRNFNPAHLISIILSFGLLNGMDIDKVRVVGYMPFRYQRHILEGRKSEAEINDLQFRLTDKNLISYLRAVEYFSGISIDSDIDIYGELELGLSKDVQLKDNSFDYNLYSLYQMGYEAGKKISESDKKRLI